jgi:hypothetical protein
MSTVSAWQDAEKVRQPVLFIWSVRSVWSVSFNWFVLFIWLNQTNQIDQINQITRQTWHVSTVQVIEALLYRNGTSAACWALLTHWPLMC